MANNVREGKEVSTSLREQNTLGYKSNDEGPYNKLICNHNNKYISGWHTVHPVISRGHFKYVILFKYVFILVL